MYLVFVALRDVQQFAILLHFKSQLSLYKMFVLSANDIIETN